MPAISRIRYTNIVYENGAKRYIDNIFQFEGHNGVILLENGGGKTVFLQTLIQVVLPHEKVADRKIAETLLLNNNIAHIAVEWILNDNPRRYALTAVSLFLNSKDELGSYKFAYEYGSQDGETIETLPFVRRNGNKHRPANRDEIADFYRNMSNKNMVAKFYSDSESIKSYQKYIEDSFKIIPAEWAKLAVINTSEGGVEEYFSKCSTTGELVDRLLVPTVEEALAGNGSKDFVELFEKQREHFRKQIELRDRIEECQAVDQELTVYNTGLKACYDLELSLTIYKQELKATFEVITSNHLACTEELGDVQRANHEVKEKQKYNSQQEQALELALTDRQVVAVETQERLAKLAYDQEALIMDDKQAQHDNLQVSKYKSLIKVQNEIIDDTKQAIDLLENDEETLDIQDELEENSEELKGYFVGQEHDIQNRLGQVERQRQNMETEKKAYVQAQSNIDVDMQKIQRKIGDVEGQIKVYVELQGKIEQQILADHINETVEGEFEKWKIQQPKVQADQERFEQLIAQYGQEKQNSKLMIPKVQEDVETLKGEESRNNNEISNVEKQLTRLLSKFKNITELSSIVTDANAIYQRKATIINQLEANAEYLRRDKEQALIKERLAHKLLDEYADNNYFTADGGLEKRINHWRDGFTLLESGTEYYQRACNLGNNPAAIYDSYPFWAITVITTDHELDKLATKLESCQSEMTHTVILLTEQEARDIMSGTRVEVMRQVIPSFWFGNMLPESFASWLSNMQITAKETSSKKHRVEEEFNNYQNLIKETKTFYNEHSFNEYQQLMNTRLELSTKLELETKKLQSLYESVEEADKFLQSYESSLLQAKDDSKNIHFKLERASEYFEYKRKHLDDLTEKYNLANKFTALQREQTVLQAKIITVSGVITELSDEKRDIENSLNNLMAKPFYKEVQTARIKSTDVTYETLANRRRTLLDRLEGKQQNRGKLEEKLKNSLDKKQELFNQLRDFRENVDSVIDEEYLFPAVGEDDLKRLKKDIQGLKLSNKELLAVYQSAKQQLSKWQGVYETQEKAYHKLYPETITFTQELTEVKALLIAEKVSLEAQGRHIASLMIELSSKINKFEVVINKLKQKNEKLEFLRDGVKEIILTTAQTDKLTNDASDFANGLLCKAEELYDKVQDKRNDSEKSKRNFINYCEQTIKDHRLKRSIVDGAIAKTSYLDFFSWQINMKERIAATIRLAEQEKQEHYTHTEQIINHVYTHIVSIAEELRTIPRKTRVKIDDSYKEIFVFHVPDWEEKQGKEILRNYFDALTKKIENPEFKDDNGNYIPGKVKKSLQVWLKAQQLLTQLLGEKHIKVKCRKATNNNRISSYAYSWEESNKWSGGEKWSKNMALFLGCLNYLAEKRKHLSFSAKRNRVVIADNPFGKASSDHVLNPVFFICQQLGFQFIALTAHDEGDFIRKYFPIVYSCRFDHTKDHKGQVIQAEKEIKTAFFREHDPAALERLNDYKHIDLFELE